MLCSVSSFSQTYKTHIRKAETVNVKKGNVTIGQVIINNNAQSPMVLLKKSQEKLKNDYYYTEFIVAAKDSLSAAFNVDIKFSFSDSAILKNYKIISTDAVMMSNQVDLDPTYYNVQIPKLPKNTKLLYGFISRKKIITSIDGLSK